MDECIHGFDDGMCAICFPPKEPERPEPAPATRAARAPRLSSTRVASGGRTARPASSRASRPLTEPPVDAGAMRVYHATHLDNLARILGSGAILADAGANPANPAVDVAAPAARAFRRETEFDGTGAPIAAFVPFYLSTEAPLWVAVRDGEPDPRLATDESGMRPAADFVLLVSSVAQALGARSAVEGQVVVSTVDPALPGSQSVVGWADAERMLRRLSLDDDALAAAEYLVRDEVPLERIQVIAVANDRVRDRVRSALTAVGIKARVAVYPPWFLPTA
ncbi:DarT ssDNA thymidine ADP-ribosyltransferase family protein [Agromyces sp. LHK192]|uniref:DarT ssDNA thymidine ADP-ribosyltransferase family protein n=1 Tax=Agromyces sp. LHK192 TaxID=2498704 RepID=UPI000FD8AFD8|nr:DarT ssDNA thymidine ADP-ribosyltransferase family protein [Agromyces sp. LHK192]